MQEDPNVSTLYNCDCDLVYVCAPGTTVCDYVL